VANLVLTVLGDDRAGLVDALAAVVADRRGNWERAQMTRLAGKFAGIVLVAVPPDEVDALREALDGLAADGLLEVDVVAVDATDEEPSRPADAILTVSGADRPGVLRDVAHVLASHDVSIETLDTATGEAPMAGGMVFEATAALVVPEGVDLDALRVMVEDAVPGFLVDIDRRT
jgi:glycine cleavage system regulatory protein